MRLKGRWGSRARLELRNEWSGEPQPAFPQPRHSWRWQTPGIPCQSRFGSGQRRGWPKVSVAIAYALPLESYRSHAPLPRYFNRTIQASQGPKSELGGKRRAERGSNAKRSAQLGVQRGLKAPRVRTLHRLGRISGLRRCGVRAKNLDPSKSARFCHTWVINVHFSLTRKSGLAYDFDTAFFP
jgi:hypothetical protein